MFYGYGVLLIIGSTTNGGSSGGAQTGPKDEINPAVDAGLQYASTANVDIKESYDVLSSAIKVV